MTKRKPKMTAAKHPAHPANEDDPEQSKRFIEAAKAAGADETETAAARAFKAVVKPRKRQE